MTTEIISEVHVLDISKICAAEVTIEDVEKQDKFLWACLVLKGLDEMRRADILCDVIIHTRDGVQYNAHSALIGGVSETFFREVLNQSMPQGSKVLIKVEKDSYIMVSILDYLYTGKARVRVNRLEELQLAADAYGFTHLASLCANQQYLLTLDNLIQTSGRSQDTEGQPDTQQSMIIECNEEVDIAGDTDLKSVHQQMSTVHKIQSSGQKVAYRFQCNVCDKTFASRARLEGHQSAVHGGEKKYECSICNKKFIQLDYLREHITIHSNLKPYKCSLCDMKFRLLRQKQKHMVIHRPYRRLECNECGKCFNRKYRLVDHMRIHSGEKPIECPFCCKYFRTKEIMVRHRLRIHGNSDARYRCGFCSCGFTNTKELQEHQTNCTLPQKYTYNCHYCSKAFYTANGLEKHINLKHEGALSAHKIVSGEEMHIALSAFRKRSSRSKVALQWSPKILEATQTADLQTLITKTSNNIDLQTLNTETSNNIDLQTLNIETSNNTELEGIEQTIVIAPATSQL